MFSSFWKSLVSDAGSSLLCFLSAWIQIIMVEMRIVKNGIKKATRTSVFNMNGFYLLCLNLHTKAHYLRPVYPSLIPNQLLHFPAFMQVLFRTRSVRRTIWPERNKFTTAFDYIITKATQMVKDTDRGQKKTKVIKHII